jgi:uncharacterized protein (TIRG00374 family)
VLLSLLLLYWALRDVSPSEVFREIRQADPLLFALSIAVAMGGFGFRALRWGILLAPVTKAAGFHARFASTIIGFAANNVLPARVGEFARAYALARLARIRAGTALATLVVERLLDGLVIVALLFLSMAAASFPVGGDMAGIDPRAAARFAAVVMLVGFAGIAALVLAPRAAVILIDRAAHRVLPERARQPVVRGVESFLGGLAVLRDARLFALSAVLALAQWLFTAVSFLLAFRAFGIDNVPFAGAVFLQSVVSLAVAVPSSPGFFGPFEAAARIGLGLWAVDPGTAISFAVGYHLGGYLPVTLLGFYYVWKLNLSWREVSRSDEALEDDALSPSRGRTPAASGE